LAKEEIGGNRGIGSGRVVPLWMDSAHAQCYASQRLVKLMYENESAAYTFSRGMPVKQRFPGVCQSQASPH
jgi:hypothetical protein